MNFDALNRSDFVASKNKTINELWIEKDVNRSGYGLIGLRTRRKFAFRDWRKLTSGQRQDAEPPQCDTVERVFRWSDACLMNMKETYTENVVMVGTSDIYFLTTVPQTKLFRMTNYFHIQVKNTRSKLWRTCAMGSFHWHKKNCKNAHFLFVSQG
jgi:hypothetical protein